MWEVLGALLKPVLEMAWEALQRLYEHYRRLKSLGRRHIEHPRDQLLTSRFANTAEDLETVLSLRRAFFGKHVIVPDKAYTDCWQLNPDTMKIVSSTSGRSTAALGYWSVIPITTETFQEFLDGKVSHNQMMSLRCIPWYSVDPDNVFLYVVGAVVPLPPGRGDTTLLRGLINAQVVFDLYAFGRELMKRVTVQGICGYPSKSAGADMFQKAGFVRTSTVIDGDENQPIYVVRADGMSRLSHALKSFRDRGGVMWEESDRRRFWRQLPDRRVKHRAQAKAS